MAKPNHAGSNANCWQCHYKKGVASRSYKGVRIPDGPGKCVRPGGLCEAKKATLDQRLAFTEKLVFDIRKELSDLRLGVNFNDARLNENVRLAKTLAAKAGIAV